MPAKHPIDVIYREASDAQKVWVEAVNKYYRKGGVKLLKKSLDDYLASTAVLAQSIIKTLPKKPRFVVDIGAGYGGVAINMALLGIRVVAIEPGKEERELINYLFKKFPKTKKYLTLKNGLAEKLPFRDKSIDLCVLSQVLEHVNDPKKTIREVSRVLKPGGYCHLSSPNYLFPVEQHYRLLYFPLMRKRIFSRKI